MESINHQVPLVTESPNIPKRYAEVSRKTRETEIQVSILVDGTGFSEIRTGLPFMDHMLTLTASHGLLDLKVHARGDVEVDYHHTLEDTGICLGQALKQALGDCRGIVRYGHAVVPMDETLVSVTLDVSNRSYLAFNLAPVQGAYMDFDVQVIKEFMRAFAFNGGLTLHVNLLYGENTHHIYEACFKALGRALRQAASFDDRNPGIPSTKGVL